MIYLKGLVQNPAERSGTRLEQGSRVAVIGGGPAGSFFTSFLLQMAKRIGLELSVDVYEPRDFTKPGQGCNMCGGVISEVLVQNLAVEGIDLPDTLIQRRIDSYMLHMDVGSIRIPTPLQEKRIAAVHRGPGPRTFRPMNANSFDAHLLGRAQELGARVVPNRVRSIDWKDGKPQVHARESLPRSYDLVASAVGINTKGVELRDVPGNGYVAPGGTKTWISEFYLGRNLVKRYIGSSMHIFLLDIPRLDFCALIPKSDYVTICLLGHDVDRELAQTFLDSKQVRECMPPLWVPPRRFCHCSPSINVRSAERPFADRLVFIGDCATTKLFKDGIGAAFRTAKAAAITAVFKGISADDFSRHYWPVCRAIRGDNRVGRLVFAATRQIQRRPRARAALWRTVADEQKGGSQPRMSSILWDVFTGSASYTSVLKRGVHPAVWGRLLANFVLKGNSIAPKRSRRSKMAPGGTGALGKCFKDGEVIYRQGDLGDCMYVIQKGAVDVFERRGSQEFLLEELGQGDFFGEMSLFDPEIRPKTMRASGECWVYKLERDSLLRRLHEDPSLAFRLIQQMAYRIRDLEESLMRKAEPPSL